MNKFYLLFLLFLTTVFAFGQQSGVAAAPTTQHTALYAGQDTIEGLSLYPNPVTHGKVTITTAENAARDVAVFDVLGKEVLRRRLYGNVLDVSSLTSGIYIISITENTKTAIRKLVIK